MGYDIHVLRAMQENLARKVILEDEFNDISLIGGVDLAYKNDTVICVVTLFDYSSMILKDTLYMYDKAEFPYIPGLLSFREGPSIKKAYALLKQKPNLLLINGNGILHPRYIGIASHLGVELDIPTIGVTQHLLCGKVKDGKVFYNGRMVGYEYKSRKGCRPIYVSPGNKVSFESALEIVKKCTASHKLPEPLHVADRLSKRLIKAFS